MILESVLSTVATLVAAGYAAHKLENAFLARKGYDTRNFFKPDSPPAPAPVAEITLGDILWSKEQQRISAQSFIDRPLGFWLDPNFHGDDPNWRERLFPATPEREQLPHYRVGVGRIDPVREQEVAVSAYGRVRIGGLYAIHEPRQVFKSVMREEFAVLPCGCEGAIKVIEHTRTMAIVSRCQTCEAEWEARSNDSTYRSLGQGEHVHYHGPSCPRKHGKPRTVTATHDDKPSMWECECGIEFTAAGETRSSKKRRKRLANRDDYDNEVPLPPRIG